MANGMFDRFKDANGVDGSSVYALGTGCCGPTETGSGSYTGYEDIISIGISSGTALIQDIKGSITTWTKDSTAMGHFNVANSAVMAGCIIVFSNGATASILFKSGDGTGASSVTLSADHITDAALESISGLIYSAPNVKINSIVIDAAQTWALSLTDLESGHEGYNYRQCHSSGNLSVSGTQVRVTFKAYSSGGNFGVVHASFAEDDGSGNAVGAFGGSQFKELLFSGVSGFNIAAGQTITSDWLTFTVDKTKNYWTDMAFSASSARCSRNIASGDGAYWKAAAAADWNVQTVSGYTLATSFGIGVSKIEVQSTGTPTDLCALYTNTIQLNSSVWATITHVTATQTLNGASMAWHAASVNKGNSAEKWWVYLSSTWRSIVELVSGTWKYRDAGGTLQAATINSRLGALAQAFGISQNQMNATALAAITEAQWATPFVAGTLDFACGLQASGDNVPMLDKWTVTYTKTYEGQDMVLISQPVNALVVANNAIATLLMYNIHSSTKVYVSTATSPSWTELTGLTKVASTIGGAGIDQYSSDLISITGSADKSMRWKVETDAGHSTLCYGVALNWV
jgi:hypothetical protein